MPTLTDLKVDWVSLVDRAAVRDPVQQSEPMRFLVWKRDAHTAPPTPTHSNGGTMTDEEKAALKKAQDDLAAALATIETQKAENATLTTKVAELAKASEPVAKEDDKVDLSKADPATRAYIEKMEADRAVDRERAEKAERTANEATEIAKAERDARIEREFVTKAETLTSLPIKPAEFGKVLKAASEKLTKDQYDEFDRVLKAADNGMADLYKESGRAREGAPVDGAYAELEKRAAELRKNDSALTVAESQTRVLKADRSLAQRIQDED